MDHLDEFTVNQIEFNFLQMRLKFDFTMPKVHVSGHYNMSSMLDGFHLWGQGPFEVIAHSMLHHRTLVTSEIIYVRHFVVYRHNA